MNASAELLIDDRTVRSKTCPDCGQEFEHVTAFVSDSNHHAYAVYLAACHGHPEHEAQIDVILGSWDEASGYPDHVTFSCTLRPRGAMAQSATMATSGTVAFSGRKLTRDEALAHPWLPEFWAVVDLIAEQDPTVRAAIYEDPSERQ